MDPETKARFLKALDHYVRAVVRSEIGRRVDGGLLADRAEMDDRVDLALARVGDALDAPPPRFRLREFGAGPGDPTRKMMSDLVDAVLRRRGERIESFLAQHGARPGTHRLAVFSPPDVPEGTELVVLLDEERFRAVESGHAPLSPREARANHPHVDLVLFNPPAGG